MKEYYYYIDESKTLMRFHIEQDDDPVMNPRKDYDQIGQMICCYNGYALGDEDCNDLEGYINNLLIHNVKEKTIINYVRKGKASNKLEIKYNRSEKVYELWGYYKLWISGGEVHHGIITDNGNLDWLIDDIVEALPVADKISLLERNGFYFLPLAVYEHSGITMYVGSKMDHFDGRWDCSDVGFIYATRKQIVEEFGTAYKWKERADNILRVEVKEYDCWLRGEVYGFKEEQFNGEDWEDTESCWGFISDKYGEELAREMDITCQPFISEEEAEKYQAEVERQSQIDMMAMSI